MKSKCITFFNLIVITLLSTSVFANTYCDEHGESEKSLSHWDEKYQVCHIVWVDIEEKKGTYFVGQINNQGDVSGYGHWYAYDLRDPQELKYVKVYKGQIKNSKPNGFGEMYVYSSRVRVIGNFKDGQTEGAALFVWTAPNAEEKPTLNWIQGTRKDNKWVSAIQYTDDFALKIVDGEKVDELDIYSEDSAYSNIRTIFDLYHHDASREETPAPAVSSPSPQLISNTGD